MRKPKIGLVFFVARWFEEVVLGGSETSKQFLDFLNRDTASIKEVLLKENEVIDFPLVTSMEKAWNTANKCLAEDLDAVVFCSPVWTEDEYLLAFKDFMTIKPSIIWGYTPFSNPPELSDIMTLFRNTGIVGTFEGFNVVVKMGVKPFYVFGSILNDDVIKKINKICRSARVCKELRTSKLGLLPYRNFQMIVTYVDEFRLYSQIGPVVEYISCLELKKATDLIKDEMVKYFVSFISNNFKINPRVT